MMNEQQPQLEAQSVTLGYGVIATAAPFIALTATVTAATGPIVFIALAAPQIASRLTRSAGLVLLPSALMGGVLLFAADWAVQHLFSTQLPVGVMTVSIGGLYFLWLIIRESRT